MCKVNSCPAKPNLLGNLMNQDQINEEFIISILDRSIKLRFILVAIMSFIALRVLNLVNIYL